ncbi:hypothetical protein, partial [Bacillus toyonensis]|uniref:hypothetical protein n=1 Tax=Bacillus toyonensis TaxID=155322 RepID=UPI0021D155EB
ANVSVNNIRFNNDFFCIFARLISNENSFLKIKKTQKIIILIILKINITSSVFTNSYICCDLSEYFGMPRIISNIKGIVNIR